MSKPTDLVQGTLDLLLRKNVALEPLHGWAIAQRLKQVSGDVQCELTLPRSQLEQKVDPASGNSRDRPPFSLSRAAHRALEREAANWERLSEAISRVVRLKEV